LAEFARWVEESFTLFSISSLQFRTAARFADQHALDCAGVPHLAVCAGEGATLCTLMPPGKAGPSFGVKTLCFEQYGPFVTNAPAVARDRTKA
jgi:hypothetical protein